MSLMLNKQKAFTLLEVMIAMVIFSIGLIGLAGLQSAGMRNHQISHSRTFATTLAYDLADRMRNNPDVTTVNYAATAPSNNPNCVTDAGGCDPNEIAAFDLFEWNAALTDPTSPLHNVQTFITLNAAGTGYIISIGWDENKAGSIATSCNPPTPADVSCVTINAEP